jgi:hypothetical protein
VTALENNKDIIEIIVIKRGRIKYIIIIDIYYLIARKLNLRLINNMIIYKPEEKIEFSSLMHEIKVLPLNYPGLS